MKRNIWGREMVENVKGIWLNVAMAQSSLCVVTTADHYRLRLRNKLAPSHFQLLDKLDWKTNDTFIIRAIFWAMKQPIDNGQLIHLRWSIPKQACLNHASNPIKAAEASEQSQRDNEDSLPESCTIMITLHSSITV